jgi:hypothetical protein
MGWQASIQPLQIGILGTERKRLANAPVQLSRVMSSCLCKYGEGAGFPFQVESLEDGVDDAVHALDIHKAHHRPGAPPNFYEAALDHIGCPQLAPQVAGKGEEGHFVQSLRLENHSIPTVRIAPSGLVTENALVIVDGATPGLSAVRKLPVVCRPSGFACESEDAFVTCSKNLCCPALKRLRKKSTR